MISIFLRMKEKQGDIKEKMGLERIGEEVKIRGYLLIMLFFSVCFYFVCMFINHDFFHAITVYHDNDTFMDWCNCVVYYDGNPYIEGFGGNYPAMAVLFFKIFRLGIPGEVLSDGAYNLRGYQIPWLIFMLYNGVLIWIFTISVSSKLKLKPFDRNLFFLVFLFSFPTVFALERGNIINLAFVLTVFFYCFNDNENRYLKEISFLALALAAGIKIYPAVFGLLLLKQKRIRECIRLTIYGMVSFVGPFFLFGGWKAVLSFIRGILSFAGNRVARAEEFSEEMVASAQAGIPDSGSLANIKEAAAPAIMPMDYGYNFSFKNICKIIQEIIGVSLSERIVSVILILLCVVLLVTAIRTGERWKELLCYTLLMVLIPSFSGAYVILFLFIPFIEFLNGTTEKRDRKEGLGTDLFFAWLMFLLITPWALPDIPFFSIRVQPCPLTGSFLGYFLCVLLLALLMLYEGLSCFLGGHKRMKIVCGAATVILPAIGACCVFVKAYKM